MTLGADHFRDPSSKQNMAIVFIDMVDSTGLKERQPEHSWRVTIGYLLDIITEQVAAGGAGEVVKYGGMARWSPTTRIT